MKKLLRILLRTFLVIVILIVLGAGFLVVRWLVTREDPAAFLPDRYVAYFQVPSIRAIYDEWLNLEAADVVLSRPDLAQYRSVVSDARGLALTDSPVFRALLDVRADIMLLQNQKLLAVVDLGWRGILTPLARLVGPMLSVKGFSFLNDAGVPMYRYTSGATTIHVALVDNLAIVSLDADVVKQALDRHASNTGLAAKASRELLDRLKLRSSRAVRIMVDTQSISRDLLSGSEIGGRVLQSLELPEQGMLDVELRQDRLTMGAELPISVSLPELEDTLRASPSPIGVLRYAPSSCSLLSVSNLAPLSDLYNVAAALEGKDVKDIYDKADAGAKAVVGAGIEELLFSWIGREMGAFMVRTSPDPVFFARIRDRSAYERAIKKITSSAVAGMESSLVIDGVRLNRLSIPWYMTMILDVLGVDIPEPYFFSRGDYFFLCLDAQNLASTAKAADTGDNLASGSLYGKLSEGIPSDASFLIWYDMDRAEPFFIKGTGLLSDILRLYGRGIAAVRATPTSLRLAVTGARSEQLGARLLPGFPVTPEQGGASGVLAFRFPDYAAPRLAWIRNGSILVLADAGGAAIAEASLEPDSVLVPEPQSGGAPGTISAIWAVSATGTVWRFGPKLESGPAFPIATGISSPMPPAVLGGRLALFSKAESLLLYIDPEGERSVSAQKLDAPLYSAPDYYKGRIAFYPKSFDSRVHVTDLAGAEAPGWPVSASGISFCSPRIVALGQSFAVAFLTQAGSLYAWDPSGQALPSFPIAIPGVYYATPEPISADGGPVQGQGRPEAGAAMDGHAPALVLLSEDGELSMADLDGRVLRQVNVPDVNGKAARIKIGDVNDDGRQEILLYGSGAFIAGYDASFRPLPGFPVKGVSRPQLMDLNRDGAMDLVTAGMDGKIYAYTMGKAAQ
jgi:hypothetical protein